MFGARHRARSSFTLPIRASILAGRPQPDLERLFGVLTSVETKSTTVPRWSRQSVGPRFFSLRQRVMVVHGV